MPRIVCLRRLRSDGKTPTRQVEVKTLEVRVDRKEEVRPMAERARSGERLRRDLSSEVQRGILPWEAPETGLRSWPAMNQFSAVPFQDRGKVI